MTFRENKASIKDLNAANNLSISGVEVTATAAELNIMDGVTATAAELNLNDGVVADAVYTIGAEGSNIINLGIQLNDASGTAMAIPTALKFYLADDAAGLTPTASVPDGGIAIGTDGALLEWTANAAGLMISEADGDIDIDITHAAGAATWYFVTVMPSGKLDISAAITFA
jgi:hypothetical protein